MSGCKTGKRRFRTPADALIAMSNIHQKDKHINPEKRHYRCPFCHGYHLTSQERRRSA